ncbi:hypothetical protein [Paenibacillus silvae]|uniref:hypothetical protein n=2 Tax=Paenibacillus silvae TaxID=1325358 RepID=UPI0011A4F0D7|nr:MULTISPECIES: hypothetical protein [Paenibacillus]MCK6076912.1 hypothetical protein [Paenibacillus silvae]MCK6152354.1 hypothetical protein [Paenibacillus silvae]MCK6269581.1 hypothetical protein [Paenibacillus silvae]
MNMDHRIVAGLLLKEVPEKNTKEIHFQANGKSIFLSSITEEKLVSEDKFDMFQHWIEETVINLPSYETLLEVLEAEGTLSNDN